MEPSEIRESHALRQRLPGFAALYPGYDHSTFVAPGIRRKPAVSAQLVASVMA